MHGPLKGRLYTHRAHRYTCTPLTCPYILLPICIHLGPVYIRTPGPVYIHIGLVYMLCTLYIGYNNMAIHMGHYILMIAWNASARLSGRIRTCLAHAADTEAACSYTLPA